MEEDTNANEWFKKEVERAKAAFPEEPKKEIREPNALGSIGLILLLIGIIIGAGYFLDLQRQDWLCAKLKLKSSWDLLVLVLGASALATALILIFYLVVVVT